MSTVLTFRGPSSTNQMWLPGSDWAGLLTEWAETRRACGGVARIQLYKTNFEQRKLTADHNSH